MMVYYERYGANEKDADRKSVEQNSVDSSSNDMKMAQQSLTLHWRGNMTRLDSTCHNIKEQNIKWLNERLKSNIDCCTHNIFRKLLSQLACENG